MASIVKSTYKKSIPSNYRVQKGVVLVVSLVFLIALTAVAAALMQNTTSDMKMSGASQDKVVATQTSITSNEEVVYNEVSKSDDNSNMFALSPNAFQGAERKFIVAVDSPKSSAEVILENPNVVEADCRASRSPTSVGPIKCNRIRVQVTTTYGRNDNSSIVAHSTLEQQLIGNN